MTKCNVNWSVQERAGYSNYKKVNRDDDFMMIDGYTQLAFVSFTETLTHCENEWRLPRTQSHPEDVSECQMSPPPRSLSD